MEFSVLVLGSGAATPTRARGCSGQVVRIGPRRLMLDCGEATQNRLRQCHQRLQSVDTIFISHLHGDHFFGLPGLLSTMHLCGRTEPVNLFAPKGLKAVLDTLFTVSGTMLQYPLNITELDNEEPQIVYRDKYCHVTAFPMRHTVPVYGYLFEEEPPLPNVKKTAIERYGLSIEDCLRLKAGEDLVQADGTVVPNSELTLPRRQPRRYAYCCDTAYYEELAQTVADVDLLCLECTFGHAFEELATLRCHCTAAQAATLAVQARARRLLLTHFSARYKEIEPLAEEAQAIYPAAIMAEDGTIYPIPYREN